MSNNLSENCVHEHETGIDETAHVLTWNNDDDDDDGQFVERGHVRAAIACSLQNT